MTKTVLFFTFLGCLPLCQGYPGGPPTGACSSMMPSHGAPAQSSEAPYTITTSSATYKKGDNITVTITATAPGTPFRGFIIQARKSGSNGAVGSFNIGTDAEIQLISCSGGSNNAVGHKSAVDKTSKSFVWSNPAGSDVTFQATFVNTKTNFWTMVKSGVVEDTSTVVTTTQSSDATAIQFSFATTVLLALALL